MLLRRLIRRYCFRRLFVSQLCPCGSAVEYSLCCHPYVSGEKVAPDPEHLMRSRYCAFVMQDADYLIKTGIPLVEQRRYVPN